MPRAANWPEGKKMEGNRLEEILKALSDPGIYPHGPESVQLIQTHISAVFIARDLVYKVKKPVNFGFLDFSTLEKRRYYCQEEIRLNSRFSEGIYLRVDDIYEGPGGITFEKTGAPIECAVVMSRFPANRELKNMLDNEEVDESTLLQVADKVAQFHLKAETSDHISKYALPEKISENLEENFEQAWPFIGKTIELPSYREISTQAREFLVRENDLFLDRVNQGLVKDCHGDLHTDHIVILDQVMLVDCIEFNERFRYQDTASDLAFLLMDLDFRGFPGFGKKVIERYIEKTGDSQCLKLMDFYKSYRAFVRGKVESFSLDSEEISLEDREMSRQTARHYFDLSRTYLRPPKSFLVIFCGLMGSGKTYLSERLAFRMGVEIIRSDIVRKRMFNVSENEHRLDKFGQGIYSLSATDRVYEELLRQAEQSMEQGASVILDAAFIDRDKRDQAQRLALKRDMDFLIVHCVAPEKIIEKRLKARIKDKSEPSDGRWELYHAQEKSFQPIGQDEREYCVEWDSSQAPGPFLVNLARELTVH